MSAIRCWVRSLLSGSKGARIAVVAVVAGGLIAACAVGTGENESEIRTAVSGTRDRMPMRLLLK